jgi:hypothetical protein
MGNTTTEIRRIRANGTRHAVDREGPYSAHLTIEHMTTEELELLEAMINGTRYARVNEEGRLETINRYEPLPDPVQDKEMVPFWRHADPEKDKGKTLQLTDIEGMEGRLEHQGPGFHISSLCGYYYTPEKYQEEAAKLKSYGFQCMRSRRGEDGRFWETWYLPGTFFAEGRLKLVVMNIKDQKRKTEAAIRFLQQNVSFGSMDMTAQRMAMGPPED